ncbi:MAG: Ku protein [Desulfobacterales bacterium]
MAPRAIWIGRIRFGGIALPVKLFSALEDRKVHFRLLHQKDYTPVRQQMVDPRSGEPVPPEKIHRGYEIEPGDIVMLEDDELQGLEPKDSRDIFIDPFVDENLIHHQWYDRPYYLGPENEPGKYFALADALENEKKEGIARWIMRKKRYIGALRAQDGYLKLITLRHAGEVIETAELPRPQGRPLEKAELRMAEQLVRALEGDFNPRDFRDEYRKRVLELVEKKARGESIPVHKIPERKREVIPFADLLKESVRRAKKERKIA